MKIAAAQFKAQCLKIMDHVNATHEDVIITKRGKPIAKLVPFSQEPAKNLFGYMKGAVKINGDITGPIDVEWNAEK